MNADIANPPSPPAARKGSIPWRLLITAAVLVGAMAAIHFSPIGAWLQDRVRVRQAVDGLGAWAYPVCILAVALLVGCGVPRLVFCAAGGMILGFWWGFGVVLAGSLLGYYTVFLLVRWGGRDWVLHRWPRLRKWADMIENKGAMGVVLVRQLPIHGTLINMCLGLSHVKHRHFLVGTALGMIPEAVPVTLLGAAGTMGTKGSAFYLSLAAVAFAIIWIACVHALRVMKNGRPETDFLAEAGSPKGVAE